MVRVHPRSERKCLFLGRRCNASIVGLTLEGSEALLDLIWAHATDGRSAWGNDWQVGDLMMWDNRCTMHRRDALDPNARRYMYRTQLKGRRPIEAWRNARLSSKKQARCAPARSPAVRAPAFGLPMTDQSALAADLEKLAHARVLCVGDVMLDRYMTGEVERISPEAPVPILRIASEDAMLGGAGNVIRNLAALGAEAVFVTVLGDDDAGREVSDLVARTQRVDACVLVDADRRTAIKTRFIAGGQHILRTDREAVTPITGRIRASLLVAATEAIHRTDVLVLSDYGKGVVTPQVAHKLIAAARAARIPVVVDPKGVDYRIYRGASLVTPNRRELADATGLATATDADVVAAAQRLIERSEIESVLATRSREGMTLVQGGRARPRVHHLPAEARDVFDVSGAGDTVVATVAAALAARVRLPAAARLANIAAGIVIGKVGTAAPFPAEIVHALHQSDLMIGEAKVADLQAALDRIAQWRRRGLVVGFTNGCFDLLHPGHVSLLSQARAACDRLVVGLNSGSSVTRLKGAGRPLQSEAARAAVLASLAPVDLVVIFSEDTPIKLIEAVRPEVLVKGADYAIDEVVGADFVRANGGRVVLATIMPGHSTSATIAKMAK